MSRMMSRTTNVDDATIRESQGPRLKSSPGALLRGDLQSITIKIQNARSACNCTCARSRSFSLTIWCPQELECGLQILYCMWEWKMNTRCGSRVFPGLNFPRVTPHMLTALVDRTSSNGSRYQVTFMQLHLLPSFLSSSLDIQSNFTQAFTMSNTMFHEPPWWGMHSAARRRIPQRSMTVATTLMAPNASWRRFDALTRRLRIFNRRGVRYNEPNRRAQYELSR